jgi:NAD(P) transhydrogenase subunit alpha
MLGPIAVVLAVMLGAPLAMAAPPDFLQHLTVFVLACFIGWQVVWNVTPALHTPLMSVTNAISGIIVVGGVLQVASASGFASFLGFFAILFAAVNIFGGFAVTQRMLAMFHKGEVRS